MWSLGVLTYVMLTTCSPFAGDDKQETFCNITTVNLDFPSDLFENISTAAQDFIRKLLVAEPSDRLTAAECMQHEWIIGAISPHKHITINEIDERETGPEDIKSIKNQSASVLSPSIGLGESDQHGKVKDEVSEMSVTDEGESMRSRSNSETISSKDVDQALSDANMGENDVVIEGGKELKTAEITADNDTKVLSQSTNEESDTREINNANKVNSIQTEDVQTPDSESSMCISDGRLDDDDSGIGTGTDTRAESETRTVSRNSITDPVIDKELDTDILEELADREHIGDANEDQEMLSKSLIESEYNVINEGNQNTPEIENRQSIRKEKTAIVVDNNTEIISDSNIYDGHTEMEHSDIAESFLDVDKVGEQYYSESVKSASNATSVNTDSSDATIPNPGGHTMDQSSPSSIRRFHITVTDSLNETNISNSAIVKSSESLTRNLQESVPTISSSGEKHKRGMCNLDTTQGEDNSKNQEEYEFVSVSKRVKSYEETVTRIQQFSPKIQRSPRIGRHAKSHPHH